MTRRILFCLKYREGYFGSYSEAYGGSDLSSGLRNSISFVVQVLNRNGIAAKMVHLPDNNAIDAAIHEYQPTDVVIEAFWVVPSKFDVLIPKWPNVHFSVRNHSELAFLSNEGIAMEWCAGYMQRGMELMSNSPRAVNDMALLARAWNCDPALSTFAPNWYPLEPFVSQHPADWQEPGVVHIGLFGAVRPLKNHLCQAVAALRFADYLGRRLKLHINAGRVEGYGAPALKNLRALFDSTPYGELIEHPWFEREEFLDVMAGVDHCLQTSFSETFNIVGCDGVQMRKPVVGSPQIPWLPKHHTADPNNSVDICDRLLHAESQRHSNAWLWEQWAGLNEYLTYSEANWVNRYT